MVSEQGEDGDIEVKELPLRKWTQDYKEWLDSMLKPDKEAKDQTCYISDYKCVSHRPPCSLFSCICTQGDFVRSLESLTLTVSECAVHIHAVLVLYATCECFTPWKQYTHSVCDNRPF